MNGLTVDQVGGDAAWKDQIQECAEVDIYKVVNSAIKQAGHRLMKNAYQHLETGVISYVAGRATRAWLAGS